MASGQFIISNQLNVPVTVLSCVVNFGGTNNCVFAQNTGIAANGLSGIDIRYKGDNFADFQLQILVNGATYQIDLNRDHWFGSDNPLHFPGTESIVTVMLTGLYNNGAELLLMEAFNNSVGGINYASSDSSKMMNLITDSQK